MNNDQLLEKIGEFIQPLVNGLAHLKTAGEALKAGQDDVREKVEGLEKGQKAMRQEMATKADLKDTEERLTKRIEVVEQKLDQTTKDHEERIGHLELAHHKN